jgi:hypothetical protein
MKKKMNKKKYLKLGGLIYNPKGWTDEQQSAILDVIVSASEMAGAEVQAAVHLALRTEKELNEKD